MLFFVTAPQIAVGRYWIAHESLPHQADYVEHLVQCKKDAEILEQV